MIEKVRSQGEVVINKDKKFVNKTLLPREILKESEREYNGLEGFCMLKFEVNLIVCLTRTISILRLRELKIGKHRV